MVLSNGNIYYHSKKTLAGKAMLKSIKKPIYLAMMLALGACGGGGDGGSASTKTTTAALSGKVVDGYIKGATVYCDANGNGAQDAGELSATTDDQGNFTLSGACSALLISSGGTDITTGYAFKGILKSPAGATVVTPLTTLLASGLSNAQLVKALGLSEGTDLAKSDPAASGNAALLQKTLAVQQLMQQTANLMGTLSSPDKLAQLYTKAAESLAGALAAAPATALFDASGNASATLIADAIQKTVAAINKDSNLSAVSLTASDITSATTQLAQQAEQFAKADPANLATLATQLQNPSNQPVQTDTGKVNFIAAKDDSVILNGSAYTLSQFANSGVTLNGLDSVGFAYTATAGTAVDLQADVAMSLEEVGGKGRKLAVELQQVHVVRDAASGVVTLSMTPQSAVYVYAKDGSGSEVSLGISQPSFNPITIVNNAVAVSYATLVQKVVGNTSYNTTGLSVSQFTNLTGTFTAKFAVSSNMNVRHVDGTPLPVLTITVPASTLHEVTGPGVAGTVTIQ